MLYLWSKFSCVFLLSKSKICKRYFPETSSLAYTAFSATEWTQILFIDPDPVQISLVMTDDPAMKFSKTFVTIVYTKSGLCLWKHGEISEIRIGTWRIQTEIEIAARTADYSGTSALLRLHSGHGQMRWHVTFVSNILNAAYQTDRDLLTCVPPVSSLLMQFAPNRWTRTFNAIDLQGNPWEMFWPHLFFNSSTSLDTHLCTTRCGWQT